MFSSTLKDSKVSEIISTGVNVEKANLQTLLAKNTTTLSAPLLLRK